jgi:hypothetical protein
MNLCETLKRVFASNPEPRGGKPKENNRIDTKTPPTAPEVHETLRDAMVAVGKDPLPVAHTPRKRDLAAIWPFSAPGVALIARSLGAVCQAPKQFPVGIMVTKTGSAASPFIGPCSCSSRTRWMTKHGSVWTQP